MIKLRQLRDLGAWFALKLLREMAGADLRTLRYWDRDGPLAGSRRMKRCNEISIP